MQKVVDGFAYAEITLPIKYRQSKTADEAAMRIEGIINDRLDGVIALPGGCFAPTEAEAQSSVEEANPQSMEVIPTAST